MVIAVVGLRSVAALRDVPKGNCTFHIFARENGLVFPIHKDLDIGWHGEEEVRIEGEGVAKSAPPCRCGGRLEGVRRTWSRLVSRGRCQPPLSNEINKEIEW